MKSAKRLYNIYSREDLARKIREEPFQRLTISFYRYFVLHDSQNERQQLYTDLSELDVLGRIYLAPEGINAQISVPGHKLDGLRTYLDSRVYYSSMPLKIALEEPEHSFLKLKIKVRSKILADGLDDKTFDVRNVGQHLDAIDFHELVGSSDVEIVDMRNHYETEVGHFEGAFLPKSETFREALPVVEEHLKGKEEQKILLYCTGGIRCEKASAYLKHKGFKDVNQLSGGIIQYAHKVREAGEQSKYKGVNFVFDARLGERVTEDVLSVCSSCGAPSDRHLNCANDLCHKLFIQCESCSESKNSSCSPRCYEVMQLNPEEFDKLKRSGTFKAGFSKTYREGEIKPWEPPQ
tara:strand:+ start:22 stop:1071 length:1050 start_codon:yes stop_codon:yes gene_type:complete